VGCRDQSAVPLGWAASGPNRFSTALTAVGWVTVQAPSCTFWSTLPIGSRRVAPWRDDHYVVQQEF
jgi:hypothetical protein